MRHILSTPRPAFRAVCGVLLAAGCGHPTDDFARVAVSGTVTLDGKPLPGGVVQFVPADPNAPNVAGAGGPIKDGAYQIPVDQGPTPGKFTVSILSAGGASGGGGLPGAGSFVKEKIPSRYNVASKLSAEVKAGGSNTFPFDLTSK